MPGELNLFNDQYFILFREESLKDDYLQCNGVLKGVNILKSEQH